MSDVMAVHALPRTLKLYDCRNLNFLSVYYHYSNVKKLCFVSLYERALETSSKIEFIMSVSVD